MSLTDIIFGKKPKAPPPIDATAMATAQGAENREAAQATAQMNRPNQTTPYGSNTWSQGGNWNQAGFDAATKAWQEAGGTGTAPARETFGYNPNAWGSTTTLSPGVQQLFDSTLSQGNATFGQPAVSPPGVVNLGKNVWDPTVERYTSGFGADNTRAASSLAQSSLNYDSAPPMPVANEETRKAVENALYERATARLDPRFQTMEDRLRTRLANQGITQGSEAFGTEQSLFDTGRNDAYSSAMNDSITGSTEAMQKLFDMGMSARKQGVDETNFQRTIPFAQQLAMANLGLETNRATDASAMDRYGVIRDNGDKAFTNSLDSRDQVLNELLKVQGLTTGSFPDVNNVGQVGADPIMDAMLAAQNQQLGIYNSKVNSRNAMIQAIAGVAGAAAGGM